jgi:phage portal protein BeeE
MVDARHVRRIRWPHPLYLGDGLSPTSACALWSDIADDIDRTTAATFRREIRGGKEIITDEVAGVVPNEEMLRRLAAELNAKYAGAENAGQTIVYPPGAKPQNNRAPSELDFVAGRPVARDAVLAAHATPATAVGVSEAAAYAAYVAAMQQWIDLSVQPDLDLLAGELTHFLAPYFGGDVCVEILAKRPDDPQMTKLKLDSLQAGGAVTVNEQRAAWGMPPVPWGDEKPQAPGGSPAQPGAPPTEVGGVPDAPAAKRTGQKRPDLAAMPRAVNLRAGNAPKGPAGVNGTGGGHG